MQSYIIAGISFFILSCEELRSIVGDMFSRVDRQFFDGNLFNLDINTTIHCKGEKKKKKLSH